MEILDFDAVQEEVLSSLECYIQNYQMAHCHHANMSVYTPLLYSKTGVYRGIHYLLIFCSKTLIATRLSKN